MNNKNVYVAGFITALASVNLQAHEEADCACGLVEDEAIAEAAAEEEPKLWSGEIDGSYLDLSGNTEETTTSGSIKLTRERDVWKYMIYADGLSSKKDDERTAEKYYAFHRLSYNYTEKNYVFGHMSYTDDRFSGYDYQAAASVGLGHNLMTTEEMEWTAEAGLGYRTSKVEDDVNSDDENEGILRLATLYKWIFSETSEFQQLLWTEVGEENTISFSETSLKVKVIGELALKLSYKIKYTEEVPVDTEHADTETLVSLSYAF